MLRSRDIAVSFDAPQRGEGIEFPRQRHALTPHPTVLDAPHSQANAALVALSGDTAV